MRDKKDTDLLISVNDNTHITRTNRDYVRFTGGQRGGRKG